MRWRWRDRPAVRPWVVDSAVVAALLGLFTVQVLTSGKVEPGQRPTDALAVVLTLAMICLLYTSPSPRDS